MRKLAKESNWLQNEKAFNEENIRKFFQFFIHNKDFKGLNKFLFFIHRESTVNFELQTSLWLRKEMLTNIEAVTGKASELPPEMQDQVLIEKYKGKQDWMQLLEQMDVKPYAPRSINEFTAVLKLGFKEPSEGNQYDGLDYLRQDFRNLKNNMPGTKLDQVYRQWLHNRFVLPIVETKGNEIIEEENAKKLFRVAWNKVLNNGDLKTIGFLINMYTKNLKIPLDRVQGWAKESLINACSGVVFDFKKLGLQENWQKEMYIMQNYGKADVEWKNFFNKQLGIPILPAGVEPVRNDMNMDLRDIAFHGFYRVHFEEKDIEGEGGYKDGTSAEDMIFAGARDYKGTDSNVRLKDLNNIQNRQDEAIFGENVAGMWQAVLKARTKENRYDPFGLEKEWGEFQKNFIVLNENARALAEAAGQEEVPQKINMQVPEPIAKMGQVINGAGNKLDKLWRDLSRLNAQKSKLEDPKVEVKDEGELAKVNAKIEQVKHDIKVAKVDAQLKMAVLLPEAQPHLEKVKIKVPEVNGSKVNSMVDDLKNKLLNFGADFSPRKYEPKVSFIEKMSSGFFNYTGLTTIHTDLTGSKRIPQEMRKIWDIIQQAEKAPDAKKFELLEKVFKALRELEIKTDQELGAERKAQKSDAKSEKDSQKEEKKEEKEEFSEDSRGAALQTKLKVIQDMQKKIADGMEKVYAPAPVQRVGLG